MEWNVQARVAAGGVWLDGWAPGWVSLINLEYLALHTPWRCVLGQVFHDAADGVESGFRWAMRNRLGGDISRAADFGFCAYLTEGYHGLNLAWRDYITARLVQEQEPWVDPEGLAVSLGQIREGIGEEWVPRVDGSWGQKVAF